LPGGLGRVPAPILLGAGIVSVQVGAGFAARLFGTVSAAGLTGLRLWSASLVLAGLGAKPAGRAIRDTVASRSWGNAVVVAGFGLTLGVMNFSIYQAFARIPLGIAVTIEFLGPLGVAVSSSRRLIDLLWVALAGAGVALLGTSGVGHATGLHEHDGSVAVGIMYALISAASWASYILLSRATGRRFSGSSGLVIAMVIGAIVVTPVAAASAGTTLFRPWLLAAGLGIGLLSSVIPYRVEMEALRRVPARIFGICMSLEPAVAALVGVVLLSQGLSPAKWLAIGCVMAATAGAALGAGGAVGAPQA
jgi:inner membrane transporter RhtA